VIGFSEKTQPFNGILKLAFARRAGKKVGANGPPRGRGGGFCVFFSRRGWGGGGGRGFVFFFRGMLLTQGPLLPLAAITLDRKARSSSRCVRAIDIWRSAGQGADKPAQNLFQSKQIADRFFSGADLSCVRVMARSSPGNPLQRPGGDQMRQTSALDWRIPVTAGKGRLASSQCGAVRLCGILEALSLGDSPPG